MGALRPAIGLQRFRYRSVPSPLPIIWILPRRKMRQVEVQVQINSGQNCELLSAMPLFAIHYHMTPFGERVVTYVSTQ
jgi:hypothetical protein